MQAGEVQHVMIYTRAGRKCSPREADRVELWEERAHAHRWLVELTSPEPGAWQWTGGEWYETTSETFRVQEWTSYPEALAAVMIARMS